MRWLYSGNKTTCPVINWRLLEQVQQQCEEMKLMFSLSQLICVHDEDINNSCLV